MAEPRAFKPISKTQYVIAVLWPSFLIAGCATVVFFTVFDPLEVSWVLGRDDFTRTGAYSIGFFCFWLITSLSSALTQYFQRPCELINRKDPPNA